MAWSLEQIEDLVLRHRDDEAIRACLELLAVREPTSQSREEHSEELTNELAEIYYYLGRAYSAKEEYEKAIANFDKALEYQSRHVATITEKALTLYIQEKKEEAIDCCEKAISIDPNYGCAYITKVAVLLSSNKKQEANSFLEYYNSHKDSMEVDTICKNREGFVYLELGDNQKGLKCCEDAIKRDPNNVASHYNKGVAFQNQGKNDESIKCYNEALRLKPDYADAYFNKGNALRDQENYDEAIKCYNDALRLKPDYAEAYNNKGNALADQGKYEEAIGCYNEALRLNPDLAVAYVRKGLALAGQGKYEEGVKCYNEALRLKPDLAVAYYNRGNALQDQGKYDEAISCYNEALRLKPDFAFAYNNKGEALRLQGNNEEAIECYNEALRLNPDLAIAYLNKGNALAGQGKYEEGVKCYNEALRLKPDDAGFYNNKGLALEAQGKKEEALENYEEALKINSGNNPLSQINKGVLLNELGRMREAADAFEKANDLVQKGVFGANTVQVNKDYINKVLNEDRQKLLKKLAEYTKLESSSTRKLSLEDRNKEKQIVSKVGDVFNDRIKGTEAEQDAQVRELIRELEQHKQKLFNLERNKAERAEVSHAIKHNPYKEEADNERLTINSQPKLKQYYETFCQVFNQNFAGCMAQVSGRVKASSTSIPLDDLKKIVPVPVIGDVISSLGFLVEGALQIRDTRKVNNLVSLTKGSSEMEELIELLARKVCIKKARFLRMASEGNVSKLKQIKGKILQQGYDTPVKQLALKEASMLLAKCMSGEIDRDRKITPQMVKIIGAPSDLIEDLEITEGAMYGEVEDSNAGAGAAASTNGGNSGQIYPEPLLTSNSGGTDYSQRIREMEEKDRQRDAEMERLREQLANNQAKGGCCTVMSLNKIEYNDPEIEAAMKYDNLESLRATLESSEQKDKLQEGYPERSANFEKLLASNNIDRSALEEILEGLCQIDVPDFEGSYSNSQIEHQGTNNYTNEQPEVSKLGDEETFEENLS